MTKQRSGLQRTKIDCNRPKITAVVDQCLTHQIVAKIVEDEPGFQDQLEELERLYMLTETGECILKSLLESNCVCRIHNTNCEKG